MVDVRVWIYAAKFITAAEEYRSLPLDGRNVCLDIFISHQLFITKSSYIGGHEFAHKFCFLFNEGGIHT